MKTIKLNNIKAIEFNDNLFNNDFIILQANEIESIILDEELKIYTIENEDGLIFQTKKIKYIRQDNQL